MLVTVNSKGQVTLPKSVRTAAGIKPGDRVDVHVTAAGAVIIEKLDTTSGYKKRLYEIAERRIIRGMTTEEIMRA